MRDAHEQQRADEKRRGQEAPAHEVSADGEDVDEVEQTSESEQAFADLSAPEGEDESRHDDGEGQWVALEEVEEVNRVPGR